MFQIVLLLFILFFYSSLSFSIELFPHFQNPCLAKPIYKNIIESQLKIYKSSGAHFYLPEKKTYPRFGVEVEGRIPQNITRQHVAYDFVDFFKNKKMDAKLTGFHSGEDNESYLISYEISGRKINWGIKHEDSFTEGKNSLEFVSPILETEEDLKLFFEALELLKTKHSFISSFPDGGLHVHIDFPVPYPHEIAYLGYLFLKFQSELFMVFQPAKPRHIYIKHLTEKYLNEAVTQLMNNRSELNLDRNHALNLAALRKYGTVELRLFNSTASVDEIKLIVDFSRKLITEIRYKNSELFDYILKTPEENIAFKDIASIIGLTMDDKTDQVLRSLVSPHRLLLEKELHSGFSKDFLTATSGTASIFSFLVMISALGSFESLE